MLPRIILSRAFPALKKGLTLQKSFQNKQIQPTRFESEWSYRKIELGDEKNRKNHELMGAIFWWWFLWHLFTEYEELLGLPRIPDPSTFTDEELGIPPL